MHVRLRSLIFDWIKELGETCFWEYSVLTVIQRAADLLWKKYSFLEAEW